MKNILKKYWILITSIILLVISIIINVNTYRYFKVFYNIGYDDGVANTKQLNQPTYIYIGNKNK